MPNIDFEEFEAMVLGGMKGHDIGLKNIPNMPEAFRRSSSNTNSINVAAVFDGMHYEQ